MHWWMRFVKVPGELGPPERRVTKLLLTITLAHMLLTIPARVSQQQSVSDPELASLPYMHHCQCQFVCQTVTQMTIQY